MQCSQVVCQVPTGHAGNISSVPRWRKKGFLRAVVFENVYLHIVPEPAKCTEQMSCCILGRAQSSYCWKKMLTTVLREKCYCNIPAAMIQGSTPTLEFSGRTLISQSSWEGVSFSPITKNMFMAHWSICTINLIHTTMEQFFCHPGRT